MKVVKLMPFEAAGIYPDADEQKDFDKFENFIKSWLLENGIIMSGFEYQYKYIPIIEDDDGKLYSFRVSLRHWGGIMYDVSHPNNNNEMGYCQYAWNFRNEETNIEDICRNLIENEVK
jgi:hypothetical protein